MTLEIDYVEKFEVLRAFMMLMNLGSYSDEYFIASFISGLIEELQPLITFHKPKSL